MKQWIIIAVLAWSFPNIARGVVPQIHKSPKEWSATGDFNGDGLTDWVLIDRTTGNYRVAYQLSLEKLTWSEPRSGGAQEVTGVSVGDVLQSGSDSLMLTSPLINRIQIMDLIKPDVAPPPMSLHIPSVGPVHLASLDIGGAGNTAHDDLWVFSSGNGPASPFRQTNIRSIGGGRFSTLSDTALGNRFISANRFEFKAGGSWGVAAMIDTGGSLDFQLYETSSGTPLLVDQSIGLPVGTRYVFEAYQTDAPSITLLYMPGDARLLALPLSEPAPGTFKFETIKKFNLDEAVEEIVPIADVEPRFLALFKGRQQAGIYDFDGVNPPQLIQTFEAKMGREFTSIGGLGQGQLTLLSGLAGAGISDQFGHYVFQGGAYVMKDSGTLAPLNQFAASANVFLFQSEPFVNSNPILLQTLNSGQWTSDLLLSGLPPQVKVTAEQFMNSDQGLALPSVLSLGQADPAVKFGMANQIDDSMSVFSFRPAVGNEVVEIQALPLPGNYAKAIELTLTPSNAAAQIFYRRGPLSPWSLYVSPIVIFKDTELFVYGQVPPSADKSPIQTLNYTFEDLPSEMDSDSDGVPDFVELGLDQNNDGTPDYLNAGSGLDPATVTDDSDGDGFSDLNELIEGTNPYDADDKPAEDQRLQANAGFNLVVEPLPFDGTAAAETAIAEEESVFAYDLGGGGLGTALSEDVGGGAIKATVESIVANSNQRLMVITTATHYNIDTTGEDKRLGREMMALVPVPTLSTELDVDYSLGTSDAATEAANWVAMAQTAQSNRALVEVETNITFENVLAALLVEKKVKDLLRNRGVLEAEESLSLFPYRALDADRRSLSQSDWLALESDLAPSNLGYRIDAIHAGIENALLNPGSNEVVQLTRLALDIYGISSALSNDNEGVYVSPISVLREYLETKVLDASYLAQTTLNAADLAAASDGCAVLLDQASPRSRDRFTLTLTANSIVEDCTLLDDEGQPKALVYPDGSAYLLPEAFLLPAGSSFTMEAFTDHPQGPCMVDVLEVISIELVSVPAGSLVDSDGDAMPDHYEYFFLGGLEAIYHDDADGDGVSNGQEYEDGTDPTDPGSFDPESVDEPELPPPPVYLVSNLGGNEIALDYIYPEADIAHLTVSVSQSLTLDGTYVDLSVAPMLTGPDQWRVILFEPGANQQFYRIEMTVTP